MTLTSVVDLTCHGESLLLSMCEKGTKSHIYERGNVEHWRRKQWGGKVAPWWGLGSEISKVQSHMFTLIHWYQLSHGALWFRTLTLHSLIVNPLGPGCEPTTSVWSAPAHMGGPGRFMNTHKYLETAERDVEVRTRSSLSYFLCICILEWLKL